MSAQRFGTPQRDDPFHLIRRSGRSLTAALLVALMATLLFGAVPAARADDGASQTPATVQIYGLSEDSAAGSLAGDAAPDAVPATGKAPSTLPEQLGAADASNATPLVVEPLPMTPGTSGADPDDLLGAVPGIAAGDAAESADAAGGEIQGVNQAINGTINPSWEVDRYTFGASAGQLATITMVRRSGNLDSLLALGTLSGQLLAGDDDSAGNGNALIYRFRIPYSGTFQIAAASYDGASVGDYRLGLVLEDTTGGPVVTIGTWIEDLNGIERPSFRRGSRVFFNSAVYNPNSFTVSVYVEFYDICITCGSNPTRNQIAAGYVNATPGINWFYTAGQIPGTQSRDDHVLSAYSTYGGIWTRAQRTYSIYR